MAAYLTTALVVGAVAARHLLKRRATAEVRTMFSMSLGMIAGVAPLQILAGDLHGLNTLEHQPQKVMAMEGHFDSYPDGAPLILFGIPDARDETVHAAIAIPKLSSLILHHDLNAPVEGLKTIPPDERPPVGILFWSFRVMVLAGLLMLALGLAGLWLRLRGRLFESRRLQRFALLMGPAGFVAVLAGWVTTEVGRQPYVVYNVLRTADAASPITASGVAGSLTAFVIVYFLVFGAGTAYLLQLMSQPPQTAESGRREGPIRTAGITPAPGMQSHGAPESDRSGGTG
jgi:cytochrome d ubiquinol oxidase subunit I